MMNLRSKTGWAIWSVVLFSLGASSALRGASDSDHTFRVRDYGAKGDGVTLDHLAINRAIEECATSGGGQVFVPAGKYLCGTIRLRSHVTLFLAAGARLMGTTNLSAYQQPMIPKEMPEAKWGKWHRALILGENLEDVAIAGEGVVDGQKVFDPTGEEKMRGPHGLVMVNCRNLIIRDITLRDAANYAIYLALTDDVRIQNLTVSGGWDGVHFRGTPQQWCHNVTITDCQFYTGDDSIAGRYWDNTVISHCILNSSCNGIRLIGPATHLLVHDCLFYGPGREPHRTSARTNMLSGIILQPGAWDQTEGLLDDVLLANNAMHEVASPVTIWTRTNNPINRITISGLNATGVYRSALSVESWSDVPITNVVIRNATIEFTGGGTAEQAKQAVNGPGVDCRPLPAWGVYARNVERLLVEDVRLSVARDDLRPVMVADGVLQVGQDDFRFSHVEGVPTPIVIKGNTPPR